MRLLYVPSGHPLQEADDCLMWEYLGLDWLSTGYYLNTEQPGDLPYIKECIATKDNKRALKKERLNTYMSDAKNTINGQKNQIWTGQIAKNKVILSRKFLENWDIVVFNHFVENCVANLKNIDLRKTNVFLKTYGMHSEATETVMNRVRPLGLKIIRNSPMEHMVYKKYAGHDYIIRGSVVKDEHELSGWTGTKKEVCTFSSFFFAESQTCKVRLALYNQIKSKIQYPSTVYGVGSERFVSHAEKIDILKTNRVNLVTGCPGANNTYSFVEAFIMGQPIVVFSPQMWQSPWCEVPAFGKHGEDFLIGNTPEECAKYIDLLMEDDELANKLSKNSRAKALELFGRESLSKKWRECFGC
jgi:hypothetical protein